MSGLLKVGKSSNAPSLLQTQEARMGERAVYHIRPTRGMGGFSGKVLLGTMFASKFVMSNAHPTSGANLNSYNFDVLFPAALCTMMLIAYGVIIHR